MALGFFKRDEMTNLKAKIARIFFDLDEAQPAVTYLSESQRDNNIFYPEEYEKEANAIIKIVINDFKGRVKRK